MASASRISGFPAASNVCSGRLTMAIRNFLLGQQSVWPQVLGSLYFQDPGGRWLADHSESL